MRISAEAREVIRPHIEKNNIPKYRDAYRAGNFPRAEVCKDLNMRFRWDLFWAVPTEVRSKFFELAGDVKDTHIDTVLRSIVEPL